MGQKYYNSRQGLGSKETWNQGRDYISGQERLQTGTGLHISAGQGSKYSSWQYPFKRYFSSSSHVNFLCHYSYHAFFILWHKSKEHVTERNKRLSFWNLFIDWRTQPVLDSSWLNHWKWLRPGPMCFLNFFSFKLFFVN